MKSRKHFNFFSLTDKWQFSSLEKDGFKRFVSVLGKLLRLQDYIGKIDTSVSAWFRTSDFYSLASLLDTSSYYKLQWTCLVVLTKKFRSEWVWWWNRTLKNKHLNAELEWRVEIEVQCLPCLSVSGGICLCVVGIYWLSTWPES